MYEPAIPAADVGRTVRRAYEQARAGDFHGASGLCSDALHVDPANPDAWLLRAVIAIRAGEPQQALDAAHRALPLHPAQAHVRALIGDALAQLDRHAEALENYQAALAATPGLGSALFGQARALVALQRQREALASLDQLSWSQPADFEALMLRGRAHFELKDLPGAHESFERAVAIDPRSVDALCNRGVVQLLALRVDEALQDFDAALSLDPRHPEAHHHRGQALRLRGDAESALRAFQTAAAVRPAYAQAQIGQGEALRDLKRPGEALESFRHALTLDPRSAAAQRGIGDALLDLGRPDEALAAHEAALRLGTELAETLTSRGNSLRAQGRQAEALASYDESLRHDPRNASTLCQRGHTQLLMSDPAGAVDSYAQALAINPDIPFVPGTLRYTQMQHGDWAVRVPVASPEQLVSAAAAGVPTCAPFALLSLTDDPAAQLQCARSFARHQLRASMADRPRPRYGHERVRIAYISPDLREHAVSYLLVGALEQHDRRRFEVTAVALSPPEDTPTGARTRAAFDHFVDASGMHDHEIVARLRQMEIDIAVDLAGFTLGCRPQLLATGLAPVQVGYLGYPGSLGGACIDYLIADEFIVPPAARAHYAEAIVSLPDCFQANDSRRLLPEGRPTRTALGLPEDALLLCCFNNTHKLNPAMFDVWMRVLARVPRAVLWLLSHAADVPLNLRREAALRGVDPARLLFAGRVPYGEHLARLGVADLFLDTLPFNGGATVSDALWAGLPVLTCAGRAYAARMAGSLLHATGLPELVATSLTDYEALAVRLAHEPGRLATLRDRLAAQRTSAPLFDTARFTRHLEAAYLEMWRRHERGEAPAGFAVSRERTAAVPA